MTPQHAAPPSPRAAVTGRLPTLRSWQTAALQAYHTARPRDFLVTATPGAGKTAFALALATQLLRDRVIERVVVVCPTDHLRTQWADAGAAAGVALDASLPNSVGPVRADLTGYVTTYAQVAAKPALHAARATARRTLVVLDEVHHAGDGLSWGDAVAEAFERAARRLSLTGTPFRTRADERIPFVSYVDDGAGGLRSAADFSYGYREALRDGVVRPVSFAAYTGVSRWRDSAGEVLAASLSEAGTRATEAAAWRTALDPGGRWVAHVIAAMDERITHLRAAGMPDAAGLVLAGDQETARGYADVVHQLTGEQPVLVLSDDPRAGEKITAFTHGTQRMAVCVRMVSEGVDIPRAACLAWMTSYRTPLFFAQGVGRVVRARRSGESATVFLPAVRPLLALAAELETERNHVIGRPGGPADEVELLDEMPRPEREAGVRASESIESDAEFAHLLHGGRAVLAPALSADDEDYLGLPGILSPEQTAALLARRDVSARRRVQELADGTNEQPGPAVLPSWRAGGELRREVNRLVGVLAARTGASHATVHAQLRRAVPGPISAAADAALLERRRDQLMEQLGGGGKAGTRRGGRDHHVG